MFKINQFEKDTRDTLKQLTPKDKVYLKKNYVYEIFDKHSISDHEIDFIFDMKRIIQIYPNIAFPDTRIDIEINTNKNRRIKVVIIFNPKVKEGILWGKVGVVTAFVL